MIDIKIPNIDNLIKEAKDEFFKYRLIISEKFDGTKLNIIRTYEPYSGDVSKDWIVSFKGFEILKEEFSGIKNTEDIKENSIGCSQYKFVFDFLKKNKKLKLVEPGTELFFEFIQRKKTLTREYDEKNYHKMFLIGVALYVKYYQTCGRVFTTADNSAIFSFDPVAFFGKKFGLDTPKLFHWNGVENTFDESITEIKKTFMTKSLLGGIPEGVVIERLGEKFKLVNDNQYNKEYRQFLKQKYDGDFEEEQKYWKQVSNFSNGILDILNIDKTSDYSKSLKIISNMIYSSDQFKFFSKFIKHPKRKGIQILDDVFLTTKTLLINQKKCNFENLIGLFPLAGKPVHIGHWKMIEIAAKKNDWVIIYVSSKDRENISGKKMMDVWIDVLIPELPKNCTVIFCDSPFQEANWEIEFYEKYVDLRKCFTIYADDEDIRKYAKFKNIRFASFPRKEVAEISGTQMRKFLKEGKKEEFISNLPPIQNNEMIWEKLN